MSEFKIVINEKGKSYAKTLTNVESEIFLNKKIRDKVLGDHFGFKDYEFEITGGSDKEGFPMRSDLEGIARRKIFMIKGDIGARIKNKGIRLRKAVHGNTISQFTSQINLKVVKSGQKSLEEIFGKKQEAKEEIKHEKKEEKKAEAKE